MESPVLILVLLLVLLPSVCFSAVVLRPISSINVPYAYEADGITGIFGIDRDAVEQSAYDIDSGIVYVGGDSFIHIVDYSNITDPVIIDQFPTSPIEDVEQCGTRVAFACAGNTPDQPGEIRVYNLYDSVTGSFNMAYPPLTVGFEPDMLLFTEDCNTIVVANEGSPFETASDVIDPEGSVSIIKFQDTSPPVVTTIDFKAFNRRADEYVSKGVRWHYRGEISSTPNNFSQSLEPEYVTFNENETKAYIALQENNAIAEVNLVTETIDELYPLGSKSWKNLVLDGSDKDSGINLQSYDIFSFYQPDSIYHFEFNGNGYIATANEGDTLELKIEGGPKWSDAKRGRKLFQDGQLSSGIDEDLKAALMDDTRLGRLEFSAVDGPNTTDPTKSDLPHFFGGRGISIFRADDLSLVWDSGDMIAKIHSEAYPETFNSNTKPDNQSVETPKDLMDKRSDNQGSECEALKIGELADGTRLLFVGVGRSSTVVIFSMTAGTTLPQLQFESVFRGGGIDQPFSVLLENQNIGTLDPEDLRFIPSQNSSTGNPLLLVTGTTSGNLVMYEVVQEESLTTPTGGGHGIHTTDCIILTIGLTIGLYLAIWA